MSSAKSKISVLIKRHGELIEQLLATPSILRGSFARIETRCGKTNCWCAEGPEGHPHARLSWSQDGELVTRKVPPEEIDRVKQMTGNYRKFRAHRRKLLGVEQRIQKALDNYENTLIRQTSRPLRFLTSAPKMSVRHSRKRQNAKQSKNP